MARDLRAKGDPASAIAEYNAAIELDHKANLGDGVDIYLRALAYVESKQYDLADADFTHLVDTRGEVESLLPLGMNVHCNRGILYAVMKQDRKAITDFDAGITLAREGIASERPSPGVLSLSFKPAYTNALTLCLYARAQTNASNGDYAQALTDLDELVSMHPEDPNLYLQRSTLYKKMGDVAKARQDDKAYQRLIKK